MSEKLINKQIEAGLDLIKNISQLFRKGLTHLNPVDTTLPKLLEMYTGSTLYDQFKPNIEQIHSSNPTTESIQYLGMAIATLDATLADAIQTEVMKTSKFTCTATKDITRRDVDQTKLKGILSFLTELALQGFDSIHADTIDTIDSLLAQLEENNDYQRVIFLVRGLVDEIINTLREGQDISNYILRWTLLWSRSVLLTYMIPLQENQEVTGEFTPLGVQIKAQDHIVSVLIPGILSSNDTTKLVTAQFSTYIIPDLNIASIMQILGNQYPEFSTIFKNLNTKSFKIKGGMSDGLLLVNEIEISGDRLKIPDTLVVEQSSALNSSLLWLSIPTFEEPKEVDIKDNTDVKKVFGYTIWNTTGHELQFIPLGLLNDKSIIVPNLPQENEMINDNTISLLRERASKLLREKS